ncbi:MAG: hypothetical protein IJX68_00685 [Rikenellaceae bacterium]|nr:hypothetical protein [Rikenellaceae bacterium]
MATLRFMSIRLSPTISAAELPKFRGAVISSAGRDNNLFHNHRGSGFDYRYPLVQYRIIGGQAALLCLNEGIEQMQSLLGGDFLLEPIKFGDREEQVVVEDMRINEFDLRLLDSPIRYHISRWIAFNQDNYRLWQSLETDEERLAKLNSLLIGNIISFAKGVGWQIDERIEVAIDPSTLDMRRSFYKGRRLLAFNADFATNVFLPRGIALGKNVALGNGVISIPHE